MSTDSTRARTAEEVLYKQLKYRAVNPLEHQLKCLDVFVKVEQTLAQKVRSIFSSKMRPLMRLGSMLDVTLMAEGSKWRSAEAKTDLDAMRKGLAACENSLMTPSKRSHVKKRKLHRWYSSFASAKGGVLWLASVAGIDLSKGESLSCTMDGLTAASVEYTTVSSWVLNRDWSPNIQFLEKSSSDWSQDRSGTKKLWIVTDVLYATKLTVVGRQGLFSKVMAHAPMIGAPGLGVDAGGEIGIERIDDTTLELTAKPNMHFIVGYRTMRVEYNPDGSVELVRKAEDTGLRGDGDNLYQRNLAQMEEDIFEVDENQENVVIPLLTPTEQELRDFKSRVADSSDSEPSAVSGSASTSAF